MNNTILGCILLIKHGKGTAPTHVHLDAKSVCVCVNIYIYTYICVYLAEFPLQVIAMYFHKSMCASIDGIRTCNELRISIKEFPILVVDCQLVKAGAGWIPRGRDHLRRAF